MNVFELAAKISLDTSDYTKGLEGAQEKSSRFGDILKGNLATDAIEKGLSFVADGAKKAASGLFEMGKSAVEGYSNYEQLSGGVQKLYGNSTDLHKALQQTNIDWSNSFGTADARMNEVGQTIADSITAGDKFSDTAMMISENYGMSMADASKAIKTVQDALNGTAKVSESASSVVMKNAQNAYKTAGMSANEYMETATSFSASLISSLGGDSYKAAQQTDVAMRAISDNVNTFGSNMEDVTNAFKGFSKQNYTINLMSAA